MDPEKTGGNNLGTSKRPQKNQRWNKLALLLLGLLCVLAAVALGVFTVVYGAKDTTGEEKVLLEKSEETQEQFKSEVFLEESNGKTVKWKEDYSDLQSEASKELINDFKSKIISSMEDEGILIEDVVVTSMQHKQMQMRKKKIIDMENFEKVNKEYLTNSALNPPPLKTTEVNEEIDNVIISFKTLAKPSKNAAAFGSGISSGVDLVSKDIAKRMQSYGLRTSKLKMKASPAFVDVVSKTIQIAHHHPAGLVTTAKPHPKVAQAINCDFNPYESFKSGGKKQLTVICKSSCLVSKDESLIGGKDAMFHVKSPTCIAAYFIGMIEDDGGVIEILQMGPGVLGVVDRNDPSINQEVYAKRNVANEAWVADDYEWDNRYLIKYVGPHFVPTTPKAKGVPLHSPYSPTSNPFVATSKRVTAATPTSVPDSENHFTVQYQICCNGFKTQYNQQGSEARAKLEKRYCNAIKTVFEHVCNDTSVKSVKFVEADKVAYRKRETLATFRVDVDVAKMAKCVLDLEGYINEELTAQSRVQSVGALTAMQYGNGLLDAIEKAKGAGQRKKRSAGSLQRHFPPPLRKKFAANANVV